MKGLKIIIVVLLSVISSLNCYSQKKKIQYFDKYWHRTQDKYEMEYYRVIYYDSNGKPQGKVHDYYKSGKLQWEGYLISDNPDVNHDTARWYFESGKLQEIAVFKDGIKNGLNTTYNENGTIESNVLYVNGQISGNVTAYYDDGKVKSMNYFDSLSKTKKYISYHPNGVIKHRSIMKNDTSWSWSYNKDGSIQQHGRYIRMEGHDYSENDGDLIYYYKNGQMSGKRPFKEGKILGMDSSFYESGKVWVVTPYVDSKEQGQSIRFYENGNIQERHNWNKGKQDGEQTEYYPNGNIKRISYKSNGQDTGSVIEYEQNGQVLKNRSLRDTSFVYSQPGNKLKEMNLTGPGKHFESLIFDESGTLTEKYFKDCQYCNINKTYYFFPTGRIKMALYYSSDMKPQIDSNWYTNGKLQAVIHFNNEGKVISIEYYDIKGILIDKYEQLHIAKDVSSCLMGFKNDQGKWILKPEYKVLTELKNGYSMAMKNDLWGVIDNHGRIIMPLMFSDIDIQTVQHFNENAIKPPIKYPLFSESAHNQFNKIREELTPLQFKRLLTMYTELPIPDNYVFFIITSKNYQAIYDEHQNVIIPAQKYTLSVLSEEYFRISETAPIAENNRNVGVINRTGKVIVPCIYRWITLLNDEYFIVDKKIIKGEKEYSAHGILNGNGMEILPCNYDNVEYDHSGIFVLKKDAKIGFFIIRNNKVLQPIYDDFFIHYMPDTIIIRVSRNGKNGLLDGNLNVLLPVVYDHLEEVYKNNRFRYCIFSLNGKYGIMSAQGKTIVPYGFEWIERHDNNHIGWYFFSENNKWGLMDDDFNIVLKPRFIKIRQNYNLGNIIYCATSDSLYVYTVTGGINFINLKPVKSEFPFNTGLQIVCLDRYSYMNSNGEPTIGSFGNMEDVLDVCGLINTEGKFILPPKYKIITDEAGNYMASNHSKNELIQLDKDGNIKLKLKNYTGLADNYMGFITVETRTGKLGVINQKGRLLIDTLYEAISKYDAENHRFWVKETIDTNDDMNPYIVLRHNWAMVDTTGKFITKNIFQEPVEFTDSLAVISTDNGVGIININGKTFIPYRYNMIIPQIDGNYILYKQDEGFGIADKSGKIVFEAGSFDNITEAINGYYIFFKTKKTGQEHYITYTGLIDPNLKIIVPSLAGKFTYNEKNLYKLIIKNHENSPVVRTPKTDEYSNYLDINDFAENEEFHKADSIPDENKKRIIMNYLMSLYGLKLSYLYEGYFSYNSQTLGMFYSTNKYHFDFSWDDCDGDFDQQNINITINDLLNNCFSITEEHYNSWAGCHSTGGVSDVNIIFNNLRINKNKLDTLSLDDLFTDKKNYPDILNALLENELKQKAEMNFSCDSKVTVFEKVQDHFIISRDALKFYLPIEGTHFMDTDVESLYIELVVPWKNISSIINKKLLDGIKL